jgi:hypothetical protein
VSAPPPPAPPKWGQAIVVVLAGFFIFSLIRDHSRTVETAVFVIIGVGFVALLLWMSTLLFRSQKVRLAEFALMIAILGNAIGWVARLVLDSGENRQAWLWVSSARR